MKVSYATLQKYFTQPLPDLRAVRDAFTFHSFEIDGIEGDVLDIKVLPNRAGDCSTEEGIARQLSAILDVSLASEYAKTTPGTTVIRTSLAQINEILGSTFTNEEVKDVFRRLRFQTRGEGDIFVITPPSYRGDIAIPVDIAEEVGQIMGYDRVPALELPPGTIAPDQARYRGIERMKDQLVAEGFIEVSTQAFVQEGEVQLANPLDKTRPFLRPSLAKNLQDTLGRAKQYMPLLFTPGKEPKLFEIGSVFPKKGEYLELSMTESVPAWGPLTTDNLTVATLEDYGKDYTPEKHAIGTYKPFSIYPFITRDIAFWAPLGANEGLTKSLIEEQAGKLLVRLDQFDRFEKGTRVSHCFRLVFQSSDRTLTDDEVNTIMQKVATALTTKGFEIR